MLSSSSGSSKWTQSKVIHEANYFIVSFYLSLGVLLQGIWKLKQLRE